MTLRTLPVTPKEDTSIPTRLLPTDYITGKLLASNSRYMFGLKSGALGTQLYRMDAAGTWSLGVDALTLKATSSIVQIIAYDSVVFMVLSASADGTGAKFLYKSIDDGLTFSVCTIGSDAGNIGKSGAVHNASSTILGTRGMCEATINGAKVYFFGEYNTSGARARASATVDTSPVRIWKSTDGGATFTQVTAWNPYPGTEVLRHIHFIKQDPVYPQYMWIGTGDDGDATIGWGGTIIRWDMGAAPTWTDNLSPVALNSVTGFKTIAGVEGNRNAHTTTDLIFTPEGWIINPVDFGSNAIVGSIFNGVDVGIFRFDRDMTVYQRIDTQNLSGTAQYRAQYWGLRTSGGTYVTVEIMDGTPTEHFWNVYTSSNGKKWYKSGRILLKTTATAFAPAGLFEFNGKIYISFSLGAGKAGGDAVHTTVLTPSGQFDGQEPEILHPVYWVSPTGTNAQTAAHEGWSPALPWLTLKYALSQSSARMVLGGRIIMKAGTYAAEDNTDPYASNADLSDAQFDRITIEGEGSDKTFITGAPANYWMNFKDTIASGSYAALIGYVKDLTVSGCKVSNTASLTQTVEFRRCVLGSKAATPLSNLYCNVGTFKVRQSTLLAGASTNNANVSGGSSTGGFIDFEGCLLDGGSDGMYHNGRGTGYNLANCTIVNYTNAALEIGGGITAGVAYTPTMRNVVMHSAGGTYSILDSRTGAGMYTGDNPLKFCRANKTTWQNGQSNGGLWAAGVGNVAINTASPFTNFAGFDYTIPVTGSDCYHAGTYSAGVKYLSGVVPNSNYRPNIGAY